jgi:hypothetical protein
VEPMERIGSYVINYRRKPSSYVTGHSGTITSYAAIGEHFLHCMLLGKKS